MNDKKNIEIGRLTKPGINKAVIANNEIRWIPENIVRKDGATKGEDSLPQHYVSKIFDIKIQNGKISFRVQKHKDLLMNDYEYDVTLDESNMKGYYESTEIKDRYKGRIRIWEKYTNGNKLFIRGLWNEYSGRKSNLRSRQILSKTTGITMWPENWIFYVAIEKM